MGCGVGSQFRPLGWPQVDPFSHSSRSFVGTRVSSRCFANRYLGSRTKRGLDDAESAFEGAVPLARSQFHLATESINQQAKMERHSTHAHKTSRGRCKLASLDGREGIPTRG